VDTMAQHIQVGVNRVGQPASRVSDFAPGPAHQETVFVCGHPEHGWACPRRVRTFPICPQMDQRGGAG